MNASEWRYRVTTPEEADLLKRRRAAAQVELERQHGRGRPPFSLQDGQLRHIRVGPDLFSSEEIKTFPEFMMQYFRHCFGEEWWKEQVARHPEKRHTLFRWYLLACEHAQKTIIKPGELGSGPMNGAAIGVTFLAYGLYLLKHNVEIQKRLLQRLRHDKEDQIFGAVYEVWIAASMIWAGFTLRLEDESDRRQTHCEFVAMSRNTGKSYSVEAKVCAPGQSGHDGKSDRALRRQLSRALSKNAAYPRLVFIDLNQPGPLGEADIDAWLESRAKALRRQEHALRDGPSAVVILTNWPYRHHLDSIVVPRHGIMEGFKIPELRFDARATLRELGDRRQKHADLFGLLKAIERMPLPLTLDGELASRAFAKDHVRRVLIGEKQECLIEDGKTAVGELLDAVVDEDTKQIHGILKLEDGTYARCTKPMSDGELAAYRESPETFFGVIQQVPEMRPLLPIEHYERLLDCYRQTPKDTLLEFMAGSPDVEVLRGLPQEELAKIYCERCALMIVTRERDARAPAPLRSRLNSSVEP